ncbi:PAS domain-containing protein [Devosia algicola]|uniref:histidine kinase n=1 Tax=Devosia algicola TaxID=3026418 RepID=A0ABY7YMB0_9HYPH|nr:PAS domain-containing protein [Devosia algicola]WDR02435.1 PAS domain-containing protein [Devosia algicola]
MNADWMTSPTGRRVLQHSSDARPAWLWSHDGQELLWSNAAARYFLAKNKKHGIKLAAPAIPIKGQVARIVRLGSVGRSSLSRVQFLAGDKPASHTCACTPLKWNDEQTAVLIVGVDPIAQLFLDDLAAQGDAGPESATEALPSQSGTDNSDHTPVEDSTPLPTRGGLGALVDRLAARDRVSSPPINDENVTAPETIEETQAKTPTLFRVTGRGLRVPVKASSAALGPNADQRALARLDNEGGVLPEIVEATAPEFAEQADKVRADAAAPVDARQKDPKADPVALARLDNEGGLLPEIAEAEAEASEFADQAADLEAADLDSQYPNEETDAERDLEDLVRLDGTDEAPPEQEDDAVAAATPSADADGDVSDAVDRVSRYNFDELSRILNDRVGETAPSTAQIPAPSSADITPATTGTGALINLGGETLVLNRLPLGILVFRDQQVLFANRAITDMTGYGSVESLRAAGLAAIFPAAGPDGQSAGPVNHLVQRDGSLVPVTARLQSISWQGRPALMLSASATEVRTGHEAAVRAFAEAFAEARSDGYFETNRAGTVSSVNAKASALFGKSAEDLVGRTLISLMAPGEIAEFQAFLERPARFAETARPCVAIGGETPGVDLLVFAQGQAGVVSGYFGFVHRSDEQRALPAPATSGEPEPALLSRISRGVRRPLNTIIGFSDLIRSEVFGALQNDRYEDYAADIRVAGLEIAALVDELDDYVRLKDGRYLPQRASIDLLALLESCVQRVRQQAGAARVIVRSAISEKLPRITADRASLAQAVLNLLASAIDQTPLGGAVVISAKIEDDGAVAIHVRDSSSASADMSERFVVFRDGVGRDGEALAPVRSSVGLALTRSLLAVNAFSLKVDPAGAQGMLFSLLIPADLVDYPAQL